MKKKLYINKQVFNTEYIVVFVHSQAIVCSVFDTHCTQDLYLLVTLPINSITAKAKKYR